jgi:hypothetical protein
METQCVYCEVRTECLCVFLVNVNEAWHLYGLQAGGLAVVIRLSLAGYKGRLQVSCERAYVRCLQYYCVDVFILLIMWQIDNCYNLLSLCCIASCKHFKHRLCLYGSLWTLNTHHINLHTMLKHRTEGPPVKYRQFSVYCGYVIL